MEQVNRSQNGKTQKQMQGSVGVGGNARDGEFQVGPAVKSVVEDQEREMEK